MRRPAPLLAGAAIIALVLPLSLLWRTAPAASPPLAGGGTVRPSPVAAEASLIERRLFLPPLDPARGPEVEDAPRLVGIAGRLPDGAVAMVRAADGTTKIVGIGQAHDGWTLKTLSPDAALFTRGRRQVRSFLPAPEPETPDDPAADSEAQ